ncbi:hypothetical protein B296_00009666 [Ensete ventricosum]|uniref:Uncharacterized protein n=1 Tax=Ensete ventricosum TaxID=4639 RepID=A0A426ZIW0_ENSVE|nr:hypothetical protein B296_00009666 [Ensete ventricosum]
MTTSGKKEETGITMQYKKKVTSWETILLAKKKLYSKKSLFSKHTFCMQKRNQEQVEQQTPEVHRPIDAADNDRLCNCSVPHF